MIDAYDDVPTPRDPIGRRYATRAAEIHRDAKLVPATPLGRWIAYCAAAHELALHWPIAPDVAALYEAELTEHGRAGGDVDWWLEARRHVLDLDGQQRGERCRCGAMLGESPREAA